MVVIRWFGHACFQLVTSAGVSIVFDPHDGRSIGLKPPKAEADIVLISHEHFDHNAYQLVAKPTAQIMSMKTGDFEIAGVKIRGVDAYHDPHGGRRRGRVTIYRVEADGMVFVHLGDLGHVLEPEIASKLKPVDVLMIPVGGTFTIGPAEAWKNIEVLEPSVVIPMHYWVKGVNLPLKPVEEFIALTPQGWNVEKLQSNEYVLEASRGVKKILVFELP